jgi:lipopolysaccharide transport system permease protein
MPRAALDRDEWGQVTGVRLGVGVAAEPDAVLAEPGGLGPAWVIEPVGPGLIAQVGEFWRHRKTLWHFGQRSIRRMYKGTKLGVLWLFIRPLVPLIITTVVIGQLLGVPSDGVPYFLFYLAGTTSWMLFERSAQWATRSLDLHKSIVKKVYFPRLILPISSIAPAAIEALSYMGLLLAACVYYLVHDGHWYLRVGPSLLFALVAAVLSVVLAVGVGLWTAVWQTRAREVRYTLSYAMRFWNWLTPVMYPLSEIPPKYHWLASLNPMAPLVETFKWGVLGIGTFNVGALCYAVVAVMLTLASGIWYFNRSEAVAVDRM